MTASASTAIASAYARREAGAGARSGRFQLFLDRLDPLKVSLTKRVELAMLYLQTKVVQNISVPVVKEKSKITGRIIVTERSKPGEFPRADTTQLMKTTFVKVKEVSPEIVEGYLGTPLDYGLFLEVMMERQWLTRTMTEEMETIRQIIVGSPVNLAGGSE
jgi:hypothetical protein